VSQVPEAGLPQCTSLASSAVSVAQVSSHCLARSLSYRVYKHHWLALPISGFSDSKGTQTLQVTAAQTPPDPSPPAAAATAAPPPQVMSGDPVEINPSTGNGYRVMSVEEWSARFRRSEEFPECLACGGSNTKEHAFTQVGPEA